MTQPSQPPLSLFPRLRRSTRTVRAGDVMSGLVGTVIKDPVQDAVVWKEYLETVVKERDGWKDLYRAAREVE